MCLFVDENVVYSLVALVNHGGMHVGAVGLEEGGEEPTGAQGVREAYKQLWAVMRLPAVKRLSVMLLLFRLGMLTAEQAGPLKLLEKGVSKEALAGLVTSPFASVRLLQHEAELVVRLSVRMRGQSIAAVWWCVSEGQSEGLIACSLGVSQHHPSLTLHRLHQILSSSRALSASAHAFLYLAAPTGSFMDDQSFASLLN